jgi:teichuronic acid biosynthesis glycosyltransferase TuaH
MDRTKSIVFISHTHSQGIFRVGSHHLARELSALGYRVAHISTPYSATHALLKKGAEGRRSQALNGPIVDADGVLQIVPRTLLPAQFSTARYIFRVLNQYGFRDADFMLIDQPLMVAPNMRSMAQKVVYRPTDLYVDGIAARKQKLVLSLADGIVATSEEVLRSLTAPAAIPATFIPNGVESSRFAPGSTESRSGAIYVGALDDRFDWDAVRAFALSSPDLPIRLVGPVVSPVPVLPANVQILGPVSYDAVPALMASARIGLLPFSNAVSNRGRSPMKLYEYLASGLFVVSRHTPVIGSYDLPGVYTYETPDDVVRLFKAGALGSDPNVAGAAAARDQDWSAKARELESFLSQLPENPHK